MSIIDKAQERVDPGDAEDLGLDEIVAVGIDFHMERMDQGTFWFAIYDNDKKTAQHFWLYAKKGKLWATILDPESLPDTVKSTVRTGPDPAT